MKYIVIAIQCEFNEKKQTVEYNPVLLEGGRIGNLDVNGKVLNILPVPVGTYFDDDLGLVYPETA